MALTNLNKNDLLNLVIASLKKLNEDIDLDSIPNDKWEQIENEDSISGITVDMFDYIEYHIIPFLEDNREELIK